MQVDLHIAKLTVREIIDFGARVQGTALKADEMLLSSFQHAGHHSLCDDEVFTVCRWISTSQS